MQVTVKSTVVRWLLIICEITVFLAILVWIAKTYVAYELSRKLTTRNLEQAIKLDPGNAEYHLRLARLYEYNIQDIQPERAASLMRRAVQLDPFDPQGWLDLAAVQAFQGNTSEAEACLLRADYLAPNIPAYQWPIANFYLLRGNIDEAFRHFRKVLAGTADYNQILFSTAWKATEDPDKILRQLIPERVSTEFSYLNFLLSQKHLPEAQAVWKRILASPEKFTPQECSGYIDVLINAHQPEEAYQVWSDLARKGLAGIRAQATDGNLVADGDFEDELLNMGFSWRIAAVQGVYAGLDSGIFHSPSHSLLVQFSGDQNINYAHVFQYVKVSPGQPYRLQAFMRTQDITTDSGPRLEVIDPYAPAVLSQMTEDLTGSTNGWTPLLLDFKTSPKTELIVVRLRRLLSPKLDNRIAGRVWLDDVRLTPLSK